MKILPGFTDAEDIRARRAKLRLQVANFRIFVMILEPSSTAHQKTLGVSMLRGLDPPPGGNGPRAFNALTE